MDFLKRSKRPGYSTRRRSNLTLGALTSLEHIEQLTIEYRKTKTKVITLANHNWRRQRNEPIRTRGKYM